MQEQKFHLDFSLQPLKAIHLNSHLRYEIAPTGSMQTIYFFATIGVFILLIACFNYVNLSTARSSDSAKEIGVKKVLGVNRADLIIQNLCQTLVITFISFLIALMLLEVLNPVFIKLSGKKFYYSIHPLY